jgi:arylsulfatase A-like enzyme
MPNLSRLAQRGVVVEQAVSNHPFGPFARAALLTGRPSDKVGVVDYFDSLPVEVPTVAQAFALADYETAWIGKWHLFEGLREEPPVGESQARVVVPEGRRGGFGWWEGFEGGFQNVNPWLHGSGIGDPRLFTGYQSDVLVDRMLRYLELRESEKPLFAALSLEPPHPPYDRLPAGIDPWEPGEIELRANVPKDGAVERQARLELSGYYAQIQATDRALGRLIEQIERRRRTCLLVITSVHGDMHGSQGVFRKGWPWEESIRIPLVFAAPGWLEPARCTDGVFGLMDLAATTMGLAGIEAERLIGGSDLSPWIRGRSGGPEAVAISMPSAPPFPPSCPRPWRGVRTKTGLATWGEDGDPWMSFDLEKDPLQLGPRLNRELFQQIRNRVQVE